MTSLLRSGTALALAVAALAVAILALLVTGALWSPVGENAARAASGLVAAALLAHATGADTRPRGARRALAATALLALAAFYNFGAVRHFNDARFVNRWEQFHYQLGSKFYPELAHDGLYAASLAAQPPTGDDPGEAAWVRDLRTNRLAPPASLAEHVTAVRARFTPQRWREFAADHARYVAATPTGFIEGVRRDHGYNPPPSWTFVARLFSARSTATDAGLTWLALLDIGVMTIAFAAVHRAFGPGATAAALAIFGLAHGWRYLYVGAFLRLDWLAAILIGCAQLERRRFVGAGACFGYAAAVRLFPALLLLGLAARALRDAVRGERPRWALRFAAGFALIAALLGVAGCFAGRGPSAWSDFARDIRLHSDTWAPTRVGLTNALVNASAVATWPFARDDAERAWPNPPRAVEAWASAHRGLRGVVTAALLVALGWAAWRAERREALGFGLAAIFVAAPLGSYYWIALAMLPLCRGARAAIPVLAVSAGVYAADAAGAPLAMSHALMSLGLAAVLLIPPIRTLARPDAVARAGA